MLGVFWDVGVINISTFTAERFNNATGFTACITVRERNHFGGTSRRQCLITRIITTWYVCIEGNESTPLK